MEDDVHIDVLQNIEVRLKEEYEKNDKLILRCCFMSPRSIPFSVLEICCFHGAA